MFQARGERRNLRSCNRPRGMRRIGRLEPLEERRLLAVLAVSNANDAGAGSLRAAILQSNASAEQDVIEFAIPGSAPVIALETPLPEITSPVDIDGTSQPGYSGRPVVQIDGAKLTGGADSGLVLKAGSSVVRGLALTHFDHAIFVTGPGGNFISGNYIGLSPSEESGGNTLTGVFILNSPGNIVGGGFTLGNNVISGNGQYGIRIYGDLSVNNRVQNNYIGTNAAGTGAIANGLGGILVTGGASFTLIGTEGDGNGDELEGNLVSGNAQAGIELLGASDSVIAGNLIGTNADGTAPLPNRSSGVLINVASPRNRVGTNGDGHGDALERNVISGNLVSGVGIYGASFNVVAGNFIGTSASGLTALKNRNEGVLLTGGATDNLIGTDGDGIADSAERNVLAGNGSNGITIWNAHQNTVAGNLIGVSAAGDTAIPNEHSGLWITSNSTNNLIGTNDDGVNDQAERNIISGNFREGIAITTSSANRIAGNYIGTNRDGTAPIGNSHGIWINSGAGNIIGSDEHSRAGSAAGNVISGQLSEGILIFGEGSSGNTIGGNLIGLTADGSTALPNALSGIFISEGASDTAIGGELPQQRNVVSGNQEFGVLLAYQVHGTTILGNSIGLAADGTTPLGNALAGIGIHDSFDNAVGGDSPQAANAIAYNGPRGIFIEGSTSNNNRIERNSIWGHSLIGIDLGSDGATANDAGDADSGPNALQNYPDIELVASGDGKTQVAGTLSVEAGATYLLRFYAKHGTGYLIEDMEYLGSTELTASASGQWNWLAELPQSVSADRSLIATARSSIVGTSEFSPPKSVVGLLPVAIASSQVTEGDAPLEATVSRGAIPLDRALVVSLSSSDPARLSLPDTVEIPAGAESARFPVIIQDDALYEDLESVIISAQLATEAAGAVSLIIVDNESAWYNYASPMDVNGDGLVSPLDALVVINTLNQLGSVPVANLARPTDGSSMYVDTNRDGFLSPIDALLIINSLNAPAAASEGEAASDEPVARPLDAASVDQVFFELDAKLRRGRCRQPGEQNEQG